MQWDYWSGPDKEDRRIKFADQFLPEYQANGDETQRRIAAVVVAFQADTGILLPEGYSSGWRPASVNKATANAGARSLHLTANAGDKRDTVDGEFSWWCLRNGGALAQHQLWMEHPVATVVRSWRASRKAGREPAPWCHLQRAAPNSGARIFFPDTPSIKEWDTFIRSGNPEGTTFAAWAALQKRDDDDV